MSWDAIPGKHPLILRYRVKKKSETRSSAMMSRNDQGI